MMNRDWFSRQSASAHTLLSDPSGSMPDEEFGAKTLRMAELLSQSFPDRHSHVGLWGENSLDYLIALFAVLRAGHVAVPLNSRFSPRELADISEAANLSGILVPR